MTLIAAALSEELGLAFDLCQNRSRIQLQGVRAWTASHAGRTITLLKTGIGPRRAEASLSLLLKNTTPARMLILGYCGALDPTLKAGAIVVSLEASLLSDDPSASFSLENLPLAGTWALAESPALYEKGIPAGLPLNQGSTLTSHHVLGKPSNKEILNRRFRAAIVDMETAALARAAEPFGISLACVRAVTDEAADDFLAPFSYDPKTNMASRAVQVFKAGNWIQRYSQWRERATIARNSLKEFLAWYLDSYLPGSPDVVEAPRRGTAAGRLC